MKKNDQIDILISSHLFFSKMLKNFKVSVYILLSHVRKNVNTQVRAWKHKSTLWNLDYTLWL